MQPLKFKAWFISSHSLNLFCWVLTAQKILCKIPTSFFLLSLSQMTDHDIIAFADHWYPYHYRMKSHKHVLTYSPRMNPPEYFLQQMMLSFYISIPEVMVNIFRASSTLLCAFFLIALCDLRNSWADIKSGIFTSRWVSYHFSNSDLSYRRSDNNFLWTIVAKICKNICGDQHRQVY